MFCLTLCFPLVPPTFTKEEGTRGREGAGAVRNYAYVAGSSFRCFESWISIYKRTKAETLEEEQEQKIKLKRPEISFSLNQENKKVSRVVELEIRFHRYEIRIESFQVKNTIKISFVNMYNTIATSNSSTGTSINHFLMIVITKGCLVFKNILRLCVIEIYCVLFIR